MTSGIWFPVVCIFFSTLIMIIYFSKQRMKNIENRIYEVLVVSNFIGLIIEIMCYYFIRNISDFPILGNVVLRLYLFYLCFFIAGFTDYNVVITYKSKYGDKKDINKFFKRVLTITTVLVILEIPFLVFLPMNIYNDNNIVAYTYGSAVDFVYLVAGISIFIWFSKLIRNVKNLKNKKYLPLFVFLAIGAVATIIQYKFPAMLLMTSMETLVISLMYHTIENPDMKMINALQIARDQADKANRAKTDFLSSMSHEIRTPLNAIVGFSDCIKEAESLGEAKENAQDIVNASKTLLEIVNGILDISKIEAGKVEIVNSKYDAVSTFNELAKLITPKMKDKGLDFSFNIAHDLPDTLYGDHANLKKIVTNLLSNACKYTDRGFVHYEVNCVNSKGVCKLIISVEDSGRGIKKENIDKMFTKFQRLDEDRNTTIEGTGLGLAITKQLIELMGGRIIVHTVYGEGSKFTVILNQKIEKADVLETHHIKTTLDLNNIRILLVDDTALNLKVASKLLERYGANQIVTCDSGFECLEKIRRGEEYDLILLDDMMPKMSGVETLKKLKEIPGFRVPTVALTANAITGMREKYLADGFNDYLAKPIEKEQLIQVINQILGRSVTENLPIISDKKENGNVGSDIVTVDLENSSRDKIIPITDLDLEITMKLDKSKLEEVKLDIPEIKVDHIEDIEVLDDVLEIEPIELVSDVGEKSLKIDRSYLEENGCDINQALELLGDMDMYNMTINDFMTEVESKWEKIVNYKNSLDMENYAIEVHSLKSDCKYLGFMALADIAYLHELKSKDNDTDFVVSNFLKLETEYKKALEVARVYVEANPVDE